MLDVNRIKNLFIESTRNAPYGLREPDYEEYIDTGLNIETELEKIYEAGNYLLENCNISLLRINLPLTGLKRFVVRLNDDKVYYKIFEKLEAAEDFYLQLTTENALSN